MIEVQIKNIPSLVLPAYGLKEEQIKVEPFGSGLINRTWKISTAGGEEYILQRINQSVFHEPAHIAHNIRMIARYLQTKHPDYLFVAPLKSTEGEDMVHLQEGYYRLFPFVRGSHSVDVVQTPEQAYEAALQFGRFTRLLSGFEVQQLKTTIPHFHDLNLRYQQFVSVLEKGNKERRFAAETLINELQSRSSIVEMYNRIITDPSFQLRVTHHDTKISNVLFNKQGNGLCVIDLDTVMPGYFISDVGDMMRTYLSPVSEEEKDFEKIEVRDAFYRAIVEGYSAEMKEELTKAERGSFFYAGTFMIYMQALRFLTDYLNDDVYYGARYPEHNLMRAQNQAVLLRRLLEKEASLTA